MRTELLRVAADADRLTGELGVRRAAVVSSELQLVQRRRELSDVEHEERQIAARLRAADRPGFVLVSSSMPQAPPFPAALAVLQADADLLSARLSDSNRQRDRARSLFAQGILSRSDLDAGETSSSALALDLAAARDRLNAALIEHERRQASRRSDAAIAGASLSADQAQVSSLSLQLEAARRLRVSLDERLKLLEVKRSQFALTSPIAGTLIGEELPRMVGHYFAKGGEICRVADTRELLVRVQVAEPALGDVAAGDGVRVRARAFPDQVFRGVVSRIGSEAEVDTGGRRAYRVELTIQNADGTLRPGMTVFSRIDFGRHSLGWLLAHKLKQALRPELWML